MAESNVKITFEIDGLEQSVTNIDDAKKALKGLEDQAKKAEKSVEDVGDATADAAKKAEESAKASEGFLKVVDEFTGGLGTKIKEVGGGLVNMGKKAVSAFKGAASGAKAMRTALISTGIGALVVALGAIVAYWDDIKGAISGVSSDQRKLLEDTQATADAQAENLAALEASDNTLKLQGKTEKEIRDLKIKQTDAVIMASEALLKQQKATRDAEVAGAKRNYEILKGIIRGSLEIAAVGLRLLATPIDAVLGIANEVSEVLGFGKITAFNANREISNLLDTVSGSMTKFVFNPEEVAAEGDKTIAETEKQIAALKNKRDGFILANQEADKKAAEDAKNAASQAAKDAAANQAELNAQLAKLRAENIADAEQKALALLELQYNTDRAALVAKGASNELLLELDKKYQTDRKAVEDEYAKQRKEAEDKEFERQKANAETINGILAQLRADAIEDQFAKARTELQIQYETDLQKLVQAEATAKQLNEFNEAYTEKAKKLADEELKYKKALKEQEIQDALNATSEVLGSIVELVGEGSAVGKMAALAQNAIDTYASATAAYKSTVGIPYVGPVLAPIAAGVAVAAGIKNAKSIMAIKTPGAKSAPAPSINTPSGNSFDPTAALAGAAEGQAINNQLTLGNQQGSTGATIVKAYVVSSEMTTAQEKDKKINDLARL